MIIRKYLLGINLFLDENVISKLNQNTDINDEQKQEIINMYNSIDMDHLRETNPKLFDYLYFDPTKIMDFKSVITEQAEAKAQALLSTDAAEAAAATTQTSPKVYTLPLFWKWLSPVFAVTSVWILNLQAATHIPWLPFLIL